MTRDPEAPARAGLAVLAFAVLAWLVATAHFLWLGREFVPTQGTILARVGVELPLYARLVQGNPHRVVSLPFVLLTGSLLCLLLLWVSVRRRGLRWRSAAVVRALVVLSLASTSVTVLGSFAVVQSTLAAYDRVVRDLYSPAP